MAMHDALTGLPNRVYFGDRLQASCNRLSADNKVAVLCLDLDDFKAVNDTLGHPVGDALLCVVAERLKSAVRDNDVVARLGGDEFAILQMGLDSHNHAAALAERLIKAISEPYEIEGHRLVVGVSVGIAVAPDDGTTSTTLLKNADLALYSAKSDGRGCYKIFEDNMHVRVQERRTLELDLRCALASNQFELYYQPLIDLQSNDVVAMEALIRWIHPTRGLVSPADFIPVVEELGLIPQIGAWVLQEACREAANWPETVRIAVNLSPKQFEGGTLAINVASALAKSGLAPNRLELEITESTLLRNTAETLQLLKQVRALGVRVAMDDFGTGYSSLSYLQSFPFDKIKIDKCFIRDLSDKPDSLHILRAVLGLGVNLGMDTTAEGVETAEQLAQLRHEGCTQVQGFYFSAPRPAIEVLRLLASIKEKFAA
jgi:diguanylate cyclase (GGDEF)-like protein